MALPLQKPDFLSLNWGPFWWHARTDGTDGRHGRTDAHTSIFEGLYTISPSGKKLLAGTAKPSEACFRANLWHSSRILKVIMFWNVLRILCGNSRFFNLVDVEFPICIQIFMLEIQAARVRMLRPCMLFLTRVKMVLCVILVMGGVGTEILKLRTVRRTRRFWAFLERPRLQRANSAVSW